MHVKRILPFSILVFMCRVVSMAPSTLKVAVCSPEFVPFAFQDANGTLKGFDVDLWNQAYVLMSEAIAASRNTPNDWITPQITDMIGSEPPTLLKMSPQSILNRLALKTLDIGMCGFFITYDRLQNFDFVNPFYLPSGFQAVVKKPTMIPSKSDILFEVFACVDGKAQLIILILLLFVFVFGHILAGAEHWAMRGKETLKTGYLESTMDGMWLSVVVMSTMGFGDLYPKSLFGRSLTTVWIFISISLMGMLLAVITAKFLMLQLVPDDPVYQIRTMMDITSFSAVTANALAANVLQRKIPDMNITNFPSDSQSEVFRALINGSFDVAIERPEIIQYFDNFVPEFQGRLMPVGGLLFREGVSFAVSRPGGAEHPVYRLLAKSVSTLVGTEAWIKPSRLKWFGAESSTAERDSQVIRQKLKGRAIDDLLWAALQTLYIVCGCWIFFSFLAVVFRVPAHTVRNETCAAVRATLGIESKDVLPGFHYTLGYHALKNRVLAGIRRLLAEDEVRLVLPNQSENAMTCIVASPNYNQDQPCQSDLGFHFQNLSSKTRLSFKSPAEVRHATGLKKEGNSARTGYTWPGCSLRRPVELHHSAMTVAPPVSVGMGVGNESVKWIHVGALLDRFAGVLASRRPRVTWWERLYGLNYVRNGREYVREAFFSCYERAKVVFEELAPVDKDDQDLELIVDDVADVLMELMTTEVRGLLADGGLIFPHRAGDSDFSVQERSFDQLTRITQELETRIDEADTVASDASAAAAAAAAVSLGRFPAGDASLTDLQMLESTNGPSPFKGMGIDSSNGHGPPQPFSTSKPEAAADRAKDIERSCKRYRTAAGNHV